MEFKIVPRFGATVDLGIRVWNGDFNTQVVQIKRWGRRQSGGSWHPELTGSSQVVIGSSCMIRHLLH